MIYVYINRKNACGQYVQFMVVVFRCSPEMRNSSTSVHKGYSTSVHGTDGSFVAYSKCGQNYILTRKVILL